MSYYYLVASLPLLEMYQAPPFTPEAFIEDVREVLKPEDREDLLALHRGELDRLRHPAACRWANVDKQMRDAIVDHRAGNDRDLLDKYQRGYEDFNVEAHQTVIRALNQQDPLQMEQELDQFRWAFLEELAQEDLYGIDSVFSFFLRLKIVCRWQHIDTQAGEERLESIVKEKRREGEAK